MTAIEQWWRPEDGTDYAPAVLRAQESVPLFTPLTLEFGERVYRMGSRINIIRPFVTLQGAHPSVFGTATAVEGYGVPTLYWPNGGNCGIRIHYPGGAYVESPTARGDNFTIQHLALRGPGQFVGLPTDHAVHANMPIVIRDCFMRYWRGHGVRLKASSGSADLNNKGNVNGSMLWRVRIFNCGKAGILVSGGDANQLSFETVSVNDCGDDAVNLAVDAEAGTLAGTVLSLTGVEAHDYDSDEIVSVMLEGATRTPASGASISAPADGVQTLTDPGANFDADWVGRVVRIDGDTIASNRGVFTILSVPDSTHITYSNPTGLVDANFLGTWRVCYVGRGVITAVDLQAGTMQIEARYDEGQAIPASIGATTIVGRAAPWIESALIGNFYAHCQANGSSNGDGFWAHGGGDSQYFHCYTEGALQSCIYPPSTIWGGRMVPRRGTAIFDGGSGDVTVRPRLSGGRLTWGVDAGAVQGRIGGSVDDTALEFERSGTSGLFRLQFGHNVEGWWDLCDSNSGSLVPLRIASADVVGERGNIWFPRGMSLGGAVARFGGSAVRNFVHAETIGGVECVVRTLAHGTTSYLEGYRGAPPVAGTWTVGSRIYNTAPASGQPLGWVCTVAGTPGTWVSMGNLP